MDRAKNDVWNEEALDHEQQATARALVTPELQELIESARDAYLVLCMREDGIADHDVTAARLREATRPFDAILNAIWV